MQAARQSLGLPPPQSSSSFWAHIIENEKNGSKAPSQSSFPLLTPLDKNATATRLLLHDTQANLEKFSGKVDKLLAGFYEAKSEVKLVKTLFERDRETLINDIIDLGTFSLRCMRAYKLSRYKSTDVRRKSRILWAVRCRVLYLISSPRKSANC